MQGKYFLLAVKRIIREDRILKLDKPCYDNSKISYLLIQVMHKKIN